MLLGLEATNKQTIYGHSLSLTIAGPVLDPCSGIKLKLKAATLQITWTNSTSSTLCQCSVVSASPQDVSVGFVNVFLPSAVSFKPSIGLVAHIPLRTITRNKKYVPLIEWLEMETWTWMILTFDSGVSSGVVKQASIVTGKGFFVCFFVLFVCFVAVF